jgi:hypothetical protein
MLGMNAQHMKLLSTGLVCLLVGFVAGAIFLRLRSEPFSVSVVNTSVAIKINKRTGETWKAVAGRGLTWIPMESTEAEIAITSP